MTSAASSMSRSEFATRVSAIHSYPLKHSSSIIFNVLDRCNLPAAHGKCAGEQVLLLSPSCIFWWFHTAFSSHVQKLAWIRTLNGIIKYSIIGYWLIFWYVSPLHSVVLCPILSCIFLHLFVFHNGFHNYLACAHHCLFPLILCQHLSVLYPLSPTVVLYSIPFVGCCFCQPFRCSFPGLHHQAMPFRGQ